MIKVFGYLKREPGLSPQEFADYYEHNHVPLVLSKAFMPMVYKRNYIQREDTFNIEGDEIRFDCVTELVFADRDDLSAWIAKLGVDEIARDEENFHRTNRAEPRASTQFGLNTLSPVARIPGPTLASYCQGIAGIDGGGSPGRHALTRRIGQPRSLA